MIKQTINIQSRHVRKSIRDKAINEVEENLLKYGKDKNCLSFDEYKNLLAIEEQKIWSEYKSKAVTVLGVLFGIAWF